MRIKLVGWTALIGIIIFLAVVLAIAMLVLKLIMFLLPLLVAIIILLIILHYLPGKKKRDYVDVDYKIR